MSGAADRRGRRPRVGLRAKLVLASVAIVSTPAVVVWCVGLYERQLRRLTAAEVVHASEALHAGLVQRGVGVTGLVAQSEWLEELSRSRHVMARVIDAEGRVLQRTSPRHADRWSHVRRWFRPASDFFFGPEGPPDLLAFDAALPPEGARPEVVEALSGRPAQTWRETDDGRLVVLYRALPMPDGRGAIYLARESRRSVRALYPLRYQVLKLTLILACVAVVIGALIGWRLVRPLLRLQRRIDRYLRRPGEGAPGALALARADEIGDLSRDVAELAGRLEGRVRETARAAADLAHDLKNPIATVQAIAELLRDGKPPDEERRRRLSAALARAGEHMDRTVDGMLELARLEERLASEGRERVHFPALVMEAVLARTPQTKDSALRIEAEIVRGDADVTVLGIPDQLRRLLDNLLDNATAFAAKEVRVDLTRHDGRLRLTVSDDGPGVAEGDRERVFRRFFTSRPEEAGRGTGLGLAIVEAVAHAHGGTAELLDEGPLPGATFAVWLPVQVVDTD